MAVIVKNTTVADKTWGGVVVPATDEYSLQEVDILRFLSDPTFQEDLAEGDAVVNDGLNDLNTVNGVLHMKGFVPNNITGASDGTLIGNVGDRLKVEDSPNIISSLNSTSTPLSANATFTGTWEEVTKYSTITVTIFTSHASAANGLNFQTSTDGTNWDDGDLFTMPAMSAGEAKVYSFGVTSRYFRIVYTNGGTNQTAFRLQTILHSTAIKNSSHRVDDSISDEDDAELVKSILTGKTSSGNYKNVAVDSYGRLIIGDETSNPIPSIRFVERRVLTSGGVYARTEYVNVGAAIKEFTFGGRGPGEGMFGKYTSGVEEQVPGGGFNSSENVALWTWTGSEAPLGGTPAYSTAQAYEGTGSVQVQFDDSDANHTIELTYTWGSAQSLDSWRYVSARFYNSPPGGGTTTRTISIVLTDAAANKRFYSVSGLTNAAPFNASGWIQILGEIRIPTSQTGSTFDINNVVSISVRMVDNNNKSGTIYWDDVRFIGQIEIRQKIYTNGNTIHLPFDPVVSFNSGEVIYLAIRNNDTTAKEFQLTVGGVES